VRLRRRKDAAPVKSPELPSVCSQGHDLTNPKNVHINRKGEPICRVCWSEGSIPLTPPTQRT
jgi:hypothetical protein